MSTRSQDRPLEIEPGARKTTQQSMIAAIGASGAVIAGGVTTFVLLVGVVSFDVWPMSDSAGPGSGTDLTLVELAPERTAAKAPAPATVPFGSGALVTEPATVTVAEGPVGTPDRPKLAGGKGIGGGEGPPTPVAQVPGAGGEESPGSGDGDGDGGTVAAGTEEPIPVEEPTQDEDEGQSDQDDQNGRPQRPSRPSRPTRPAPAPAPAPGPVTSGAATTAPDGSGASGGAGGSGSGGNGNHGGQD